MKKNVVITILAVLVVGLGCFLVYDKAINNTEEKKENSLEKDTTSQKEEENKIELAYARELVYKYISAGGLGDSRRSTLLNEGLTEEAKLALAINYATPISINYTCEEAFPDATKANNQFIIKRGNFYGVCSSDDATLYSYDQYPYDSVNDSYKKLFGEELSAPKIDMGKIEYDFGIYAYSSKYDAYIEVSCQCGGTWGGPTKSYFEVKNEKFDGDTLTVDMVYIFLSKPIDNNKSFDEIDYVGKINGQEVRFNTKESENEEVFLNKYLDKLDTYRIEFVFKDKAYKLVNIKKVS